MDEEIEKQGKMDFDLPAQQIFEQIIALLTKDPTNQLCFPFSETHGLAINIVKLDNTEAAMIKFPNEF